MAKRKASRRKRAAAKKRFEETLNEVRRALDAMEKALPEFMEAFRAKKAGEEPTPRRCRRIRGG